MRIESDRLVYSQITEDDWSFFLALNQDKDVMTYVSEIRNEKDIREQSFDTRLPEWRLGCAHWLCLTMVTQNTMERVGVTGFIDRGDGIAEVGFLLAKDFHGKGYGLESLSRICGLAFDHYGFRKLSATVTAGNEGSKKTLLKAGFSLEGTIRENFFLHGIWRDDWVFGLLKKEFSHRDSPIQNSR